MGSRSAGRAALMAIHPGYANAILDGAKGVEFRKRPLAPDVTTVVMYATAPVKSIVGEFKIDRTLRASPDDMWLAVGSIGAINEAAYRAYYADSSSAVGFLVTAACRYPVAIPLATIVPQPAVPQSFTYVDADDLERLRELGGAALRRTMLSVIANRLSTLIRLLPLGPLRVNNVPLRRTQDLSIDGLSSTWHR